MIERPVMFGKKQYFKNKEDFLELFNRIESDSIEQDFNSVPCFAPKEGVQKLKDSKDFAGDILLLCGLKNNSTFQSYYNAGFNEFAEFLGLWVYGFRSLEAIDRIMNADKKRYFAQAVYQKECLQIIQIKKLEMIKYTNILQIITERTDIFKLVSLLSELPGCMSK